LPKNAIPVPAASRQTFIFSAKTWRHRLAEELVAAGLDHDRAGLIARKVLAAMTREAPDLQ
jgi:hypothetical protein